RPELGPVEALREPAHGDLTARSRLTDDRPHLALHVAGRRRERAALGRRHIGPESLDPHRSSLIRATSASTASALSLWATGFAIRRAVDSQMASRSTSPFSARVLPVAVRST